ncbi:phosphoribosylaminoimidazolesuccinocarboxamide synthase [Leptospira ryugenii]|uniref:Phosphoribosylaminoimidazole-succinocarboxamide synthase n=1 Tax=Leptospira ryugenii TaxID=1917863 RepID=A0A2P2DWB3_9LEPT|nr:phosphoribosylaminoimidazolesuccinocarboxamide synthase [Leptospira ryugenii]GBF48922.1 phosphoribosylaminoimidazolesuccinocarboxamide synthase [Leptospira ryugenii]
MSPTPDYIGKVRDVYDLGSHLILAASDRISAFDVVFNELVPGKGKTLTRISNLWFSYFQNIPNHLVATDSKLFPKPFSEDPNFVDRAVLVKKTKRIDYECVVRGYLSGSAFKEYKQTGKVAFVPQAEGMLESEAFPEPIFTPARKNDVGHDENISEDTMRQEIGSELFEVLKARSLELYTKAHALMLAEGIILCDTKFEFGILDGEVILIDEILTPDSSRYWEQSEYKVGTTPPSLDKQILRNWLEASAWDKNPPPPTLPQELIQKLMDKYLELEEKITRCIKSKSTSL